MRALVFALAVASLTQACGYAQWQLQDSGTTADLRGIASVGKGIAWASGTKGTVLRTEDGGYLWQHCVVPPGAEKLDFRGIQAFDENTAIVMSSGKGDLSRLYKTTDGCQSWKLVFTNPDKDGFWDAIRFETPVLRRTDSTPRGILIGDPVNGHFPIFLTFNLGKTWELATVKLLNKLPKARRQEALFAASNSAADAVGDAGNLTFVTGGIAKSRLLHLSGGGLVLDTWMSSPSFDDTNLKFPHATDAQGAFSVADHQIDQVTFEYMVVGGDYQKPDAAGVSAYLPPPAYKFFGRHQQIVYSVTQPHGYRSAVAYDIPTKTWITVGPNGTDVSTDDGRNWRALKPGPSDTPDADQHWNALSLPFVAGPRGRIGILRPEALKVADR